MVTYKRLIISLNLFFFLPLSVIITFYLLNPFVNECIRGNCKDDYGVYSYHSGMQYEGEWKNGKRHGQGTLTYADGSKYIGNWSNGRMHGQGIKTYASDKLYREYSGEWKNGNKHGKGSMIYTSGVRYEGNWKDGKKHGLGTLIISDEKNITGEWRNDKLVGTVTETYADGQVIIAEVRNEVKNGPGVIIYPNGTKVKGEWMNNKLVGSLEFYLFRGVEFEEKYVIEALCSSIKADINPSLTAQENSIPWLNELLMIPNLYEKFNRKIREAKLPHEISSLAELAKEDRMKEFTELNIENQKNIVKLNRLLLEHLYPNLTPKN